MLQKLQFLILAAALLLIMACKHNNNDSYNVGNNITFSSSDYHNALQGRFGNQDTSSNIKASGIENFDTLKYYYSTHN